MRQAIFYILFSLGFALPVGAQTADTTVFTFDDFYQLVINNHPLIRKANLLTQQGAAQVRLARGNFDPKVGVKWSKKEFDETEYYDKIAASLKVPIWLGLTPEVGINQHEGEYLNPENYISEANDYGQVYGGISVTLGKGLFIDERRAALKQAVIFEEVTEAERVKMLNKSLLAATKDYWEWYFAFNNYEAVESSVSLAEDIYRRTKLAYEYGEVAVIDTVQAKVNLLTRRSDLLRAAVDKNRARLMLSVHLWDNEGLPVELTPTSKPQPVIISSVNEANLEILLDSARNNHPELQKLRLKYETLSVERSLARESLKPQLDLKYHLLDQPWAFDGERNSVTWDDNYRVGLDFSFPLFLRKERAKIKQLNLKLQENNFELADRERSIINDVNAKYFELVNTIDVISQQAQIVDSYELLVEAERLNLANGESDLFKLNNQLDKLLETRVKLLKENANYKKMEAELYWLAGIENLNLNNSP